MRNALVHTFFPLLAGAVYINVSSGVQAPCDSPIFCQGPLLRDVQLAAPFDDSKTFVDLPTIRPVSEVIAAYNNLTQPLRNDSNLQTFLRENFGQVGTELSAINSTLVTNATFLDHVKSPIVADFVKQIIAIWPSLTRNVTSTGVLCDGCDSSFIPPKRPFVVAGGRFREAYYWDSFFILEGLLRTKGNYTQIAYNTIENFLDFIEEYGFVPNGGRKYYLNRSQPPLLSNMIKSYIDYTNDTSILKRALPLLVQEQQFFQNETLTLRSTNGSHLEVQRYLVPNNQPRPESYLEDYETANNMSYYATNGSTYTVGNISNATRATLYQNLASAAESGWDYSSRWLRNPLVAAEDNGIALRSLNGIEIVPVDLQAIQYSTADLLAQFYNMTGNFSASRDWRRVARVRAESLLQFNYNSTLSAYFDYNLTSRTQNTMTPSGPFNGTLKQVFSPAQFYPLAFGAAGSDILTPSNLVALYKPVVEQLNQYPGGIAATNFASGQQWDAPNVWPPLQYLLIKSLLNTVQNTTGNATISTSDPDYAVLQGLPLRLAQRYVDSTYCTWRATGGSHPSLNITKLAGAPADTDGVMFEKYANNATNAIGGGGEYSTVTGFGWSNGVLIWVADIFGQQLTTPVCGNMTMPGNMTSMS